MPTQAITLRAHDANPEPITDNMTTLAATGSGNGFAIPFSRLKQVFLHNPTVSTANITILGVGGEAESERSLAVGNETISIASGGDPVSWYPDTFFKNSSDEVVIECDQLIQVKALQDWSMS